MRQRIFLITGIVLLLVVVGFMTKDLFFPGSSARMNQNEYDLDSIRRGDSAPLLYRELFSFQPSLEEIMGIVIGKDDVIFICGKNGVESFNSRGISIGNIKVEGVARCITLNESGDLFIGMEDHLLIMDGKGKIISKIDYQDTSSIITSIAVKGKDIFVADAGLKTVFHLNEKGKLLKRIGDEDPQKSIQSLIIPSPFFDISLGKDGSLWVVNPGRHLVEKFNTDGEMISKWGYGSMSVDGFCGCCNPSNISILSDNSFVTTEKAIERVKIYDPEGNFVGMVTGPDVFIEGTKGIDVAVDSNDRIFILDPVKKKITAYVRS